MIPPKTPSLLVRLLRSKRPYGRTADGYRDLVLNHYGGLAGWFTIVSGFLTGQEVLGKKIICPDAFDLNGCKAILDCGCGNGRYLKTLASLAEKDAVVVGVDLCYGMLRRARKRLRSKRVHLTAADLKTLPFPDHRFDAIVCGWVLEHLLDPAEGLRELARVVRPEGKILLFATEDTITGAISSRLYHCKTFRRDDLKLECEKYGLTWHREFWRSRFHRRLNLSGIIVELRPSPSKSCIT